MLRSLTPLATRAAAAVAAAAAGGLAMQASSEESTDRLARWRAKWAAPETPGWQVSTVHPALERFGDSLLEGGTGAAGRRQRVLVPLCGASLDLAAIAKRGHDVVGVEGVPAAVDTLFAGFGPEDQSRTSAAHTARTAHASADPSVQISVIQGDFLTLDRAGLRALGLGGPFDAAFDRASLVAMDPADRAAYAATLRDLMADGGRVLLVTVEHDRFDDGAGGRRAGPPYSVSEADVRELYGEDFDVRAIPPRVTTTQRTHTRLSAAGCVRAAAGALPPLRGPVRPERRRRPFQGRELLPRGHVPPHQAARRPRAGRPAETVQPPVELQVVRRLSGL